MKNLCDLYIRHAGKIGAVYCAIPTLVWFIYVTNSVPFRTVYLLRLFLSLTIGCGIAAYLNRKGLSFWLIKHQGPEGPALVVDGALIGAAIGVGSAFLPALTTLILTNHPALAKTFIISTYLGSAFVGGCLGSMYAAIGKRYIDASIPSQI